MRIDVFTIFPAMVTGPLEESLLGRAIQDGVLDVHVHDLRDFTTDKHRRSTTHRSGAVPAW